MRSADKCKRATRSRSPNGSVLRNIKETALCLVVFVVLRTSVIAAYQIPSASMEDTLLIGDFIICNQFLYGARLPLVDWRLPAVREPQAGDVVVFYFPGDGVTRYVKRCVAVGGDTVEVHDKQLYVNGQLIPDPRLAKYIDTALDGRQRVKPGRDRFGPYIVPSGHYFMMGDNRDNSYDSRFWGPVAHELIVGKAMLTHWSWDDSVHPSPDVSLRDPLSVPRMFIFNTVHFLEKVRYNRVGRLIS